VTRLEVALHLETTKAILEAQVREIGRPATATISSVIYSSAVETIGAVIEQHNVPAPKIRWVRDIIKEKNS
jgi:hypothetical protein